MEKKDHETPKQSPRKQAWTMNPIDQALARNDAAYDLDYPKAMEAILSKNKIRNSHLRPRANLGNSAPSVAGSETVTQEPAVSDDKLPKDDKDRSNLDAPETESQEQSLPSASDDKLPEDYKDHSALDAPETNQRSPLPLVRESSPHGTETDPSQIAKNDTFQLDKRDFHLPTQEHKLPSASAGLGMSDQVWLDPEAEEACRMLLLKDENESRLPYFTEFFPADPQPKRRAMSASSACTKINNTFQPDKRDSKETVTQERNLSSPFALPWNPTGKRAMPANGPRTKTGHAPAKNDTFELDSPLLNREIPSKSSLRNAHVLSRAKTVTQEHNLSSASTRKGAMSAKTKIGQAHDTFQPEKRDFEETVTQESDLPSAPDDKLPDDDEIA